MFLSLLLIQAAFGLAPFFTQEETIDRSVDGEQQRSYIVMFNEKAPVFGWDGKEKLLSWLQLSLPTIQPEHVQWNYQITENFRGFSTWATNSTIEKVLSYDFIKYVEEDQVMRIAAPFTTRPDYGQVRINQKSRNLGTTPTGYYTNGTYPSGSLDTAQWDWISSVTNGYRLVNSGSNSRVWIVDTGVLANHQEFVTGGRSRVVVTQDFALIPNNGTDGNGHGTHCAGSAAGQYRGVAVGAEIGNIRVLGNNGGGSNTGVLQGFNYVANNQASGKMNVLSASLGGASSESLDSAVNNAANAGVIVVVAAGNDSNMNACNYSPAGASQAITIGASNAADARASFSNSGSCVDVFSPGQNIHSSWYTSTTTYNTISGTSMATPLAAGAIAVYGTIGSNWSAKTAAVKTAIRNTATSGVLTSSPAWLTGTPNLLINSNWA